MAGATPFHSAGFWPVFVQFSIKTYFFIRTGARLGQGTGFDDLEWGILSELGIVDDKTVVATTVHDNQVLDMLPPYIFQNHDVPVDIICTPALTSKFFL